MAVKLHPGPPVWRWQGSAKYWQRTFHFLGGKIAHGY